MSCAFSARPRRAFLRLIRYLVNYEKPKLRLLFSIVCFGSSRCDLKWLYEKETISVDKTNSGLYTTRMKAETVLAKMNFGEM